MTAMVGNDPVHDGQAEPQSAVPFARGVVELVVLLEDRLELCCRYPGPGIPDLDADQSAARSRCQTASATPTAPSTIRRSLVISS